MAKAVWIAKNTDSALIGRLLPPRKPDTHKGDYGKVLLLCGATGYTGAAALAGQAAARTGAGLVFVGVPEKIYPIVAAKLTGPIVFPLPCDEEGRLSTMALPEILRRLSTVDACLLGPGLGRSGALTRVVHTVIGACRVPLVVDADGINALEGHIDVLRGKACPVILTPHDGEFRRLGGSPEGERVLAAKKLALDTGCIVLRKGHVTIVTDGKTVYRNHTGNPGMATGGSGDVLAGVLVSLLGQGVAPLQAAAAGAWLHGVAGDLYAARNGEYGLCPEDLLGILPRLLL